MNPFEYSHANFEKLIVDKMPSLSKGEKLVANYILGNYNEASLLSSTELAEKAGVSDTTVIRFARDLGFKGYLDFKKTLRGSAYTTIGMYDTLCKMNIDSDNEYVANYMLSAISDLQSFVQSLDYEQVSEIAKILLNANHVYIGGLGSDAVVAQYLFTYMRKMGFHLTLLVEEGQTLREHLLNITNNDALLMCSYPRQFDDEKEMALRAKKAGATLITITNSVAEAIPLNGDYQVVITDQKRTFFNSYVVPMAFCNLLLLKINELAPTRVEKAMKRYADIVLNPCI